jgi:hypothetical protein
MAIDFSFPIEIQEVVTRVLNPQICPVWGQAPRSDRKRGATLESTTRL